MSNKEGPLTSMWSRAVERGSLNFDHPYQPEIRYRTHPAMYPLIGMRTALDFVADTLIVYQIDNRLLRRGTSKDSLPEARKTAIGHYEMGGMSSQIADRLRSVVDRYNKRPWGRGYRKK
jgi:hypothetical protein